MKKNCVFSDSRFFPCCGFSSLFCCCRTRRISPLPPARPRFVKIEIGEKYKRFFIPRAPSSYSHINIGREVWGTSASRSSKQKNSPNDSSLSDDLQRHLSSRGGNFFIPSRLYSRRLQTIRQKDIQPSANQPWLLEKWLQRFCGSLTPSWCDATCRWWKLLIRFD